MRRFLLIVALLAPFVASCASTQQKSVIALPNGYYLQPDAKQQTEIAKRNGARVLPGPIAAYTVSGEIVTGALGAPSAASRSYANDLPFQGSPETRYFVLDTTSGRLDRDLDATGWQQRLKDLGISAAPRLYAPIRW